MKASNQSATGSAVMADSVSHFIFFATRFFCLVFLSLAFAVAFAGNSCKHSGVVGAYTIEAGLPGFIPGTGQAVVGNMMFNLGGTLMGATQIDIDGPGNPFALSGGFGTHWTGTFKRTGHKTIHAVMTNILVDKTDQPQNPGVVLYRGKILQDLKFGKCFSSFSGTFTAKLFAPTDFKLETQLGSDIVLEIIGNKIDD